MKTDFLRILTMAVLAASASPAQSSRLQADVPFEFVLGHKTLPPGRYLVVPPVSSNRVVIQSADRKENFVVSVVNAKSIDNQQVSKLVFHRYGERHFLAQLWVRGSNWEWEIPPTSQERELAAQRTIDRNQSIVGLR
jgi:hypothetical protein